MNHQGTELIQAWLGNVLVRVTSPWEVQGGVIAWLCLQVSCHWGCF